MANAKGKTVDQTYLSVNMAEDRGFLHRDYIAHCFRWSHVVKVLMRGEVYKTARLLDVGCGRELPLAKMLYSSRMTGIKYVGVDAGPVNEADYLKVTHTSKFSADIFDCEEYDKLTWDSWYDGETKFTRIVCFEVLEHVEPHQMRCILRKMQEDLVSNGYIYISTPCWDRVSCAGNHVNEMTYHALGALFEDMGFSIEEVYGTFASIKDYKHELSKEHAEVFDKLREYYDTNVLSTIFAPLYPAHSRNCLWILRPGQLPSYNRKFAELLIQDAPWGSSDNWREMDGE